MSWTDQVVHGQQECDWERSDTFKCGACGRRCCYCFGCDSPLKSFVDLCDDCWVYATQQAELDGIDPEGEAEMARRAA